MAANVGAGRSIKELLKTNEMLKGVESQRLRTYCCSEYLIPDRDLDEFGMALCTGNLDGVKREYEKRVFEAAAIAATVFKGELENAGQEAKDGVRRSLHNERWGPTGVTIYNLIGLGMQLFPHARPSLIQTAKFLIDTAKVPVDGRDYSGTTALSHCYSTKPAFDLEYAQMLYDAGGDVNSRDRYGGTVAHEIAKVYNITDTNVVRQAVDALSWYLQHGGNVDIADGDGVTARSVATKMQAFVSGLLEAIRQEDKIRSGKKLACACCGREDPALLTCGRCKKVRYCSPKTRSCQKLDWPRHKKECKSSEA